MKNTDQVASAKCPASLSHAKLRYHQCLGMAAAQNTERITGSSFTATGPTAHLPPTQLSEATPLPISTAGLYRSLSCQGQEGGEGGMGSQAEEHHKDISPPLLFQPF